MHASGWQAHPVSCLQWLTRGVGLAVFADLSALVHRKSAMSLITYLVEDNDIILTNRAVIHFEPAQTALPGPG